MKNILLCLAIFVSLLNGTTYAQNWDTVGRRGFSTGESDYVSMAIDTGGTPYVVYSDVGHFADAAVMKYNGGSWVEVGVEGNDSDGANFTSIAIDRGGAPFIVYQDLGDIQKATVMKFNGSSWEYVGNRGFSAGNVAYTNIALDSMGTPYIVYQDDSFPCCDGGPTTVKKFDGANWVNVGNPRFTNAGAMSRIAIDKNGIPYVAYEDFVLGKTAVMKFNGVAWAPVDFAGWFARTPDEVLQNMSLSIDTSGTPYVAISDATNGNKATVMKFDGSNWVSVGMAGFSDTEADFITIAVDKAGIPYVAFEEGTTYFPTYVMRYNGSSWVYVDSPAANTLELYPGIAISPAGTPYVCYQDFHAGKKVTVKKYEIPTEAKNIVNPATGLIIVPNPNNGSFTLNISSVTKEDANIIITDILGEKVKELITTTNTETKMELKAPPGIYFISTITKEGSSNAKIMID